MNRLEYARDFAGADWQNLSPKSRVALLRRAKKSEVLADHSWWQLPPTVKMALMEPLIKGPTIARIRN